MYVEGNIIRFDPFYFKNGNTAKPKYFVVLKVIDGDTVFASLPTRNDFIPRNFDSPSSGCIDIPDFQFNCFHFPSSQIITTCSKSFDFDTYIYGENIDSYDLEYLNLTYTFENIDYSIFGMMKPDLFANLISCLKESKTVKRVYKRML